LHQRALEIRERLCRDHPSVLEHQSDLALTFVNMGELLSKTAQPDKAMESYRRAESIFERLSRHSPSTPDYKSGLGVCLHNMAEVEMSSGQWKQARDRLESAIAQQRSALAVLPGHPLYQLFLRGHLLNQAKAQRAMGQPEESLRSARELAILAHGNPSELYNAACALASIIPNAGESERQALATEAVQILKEAAAAGWNDAGKASRDPDLAPLRDRDDFRRLLAEMFDRGFPADPFAK
jgi:tetratricopeptide (TPR) repeat protein